MKVVKKNTQDLYPGDFVINLGILERVERRMGHGNSNYYWLTFSRPQFNQGSSPTATWYLLEKAPTLVRKQGHNIGGATID